VTREMAQPATDHRRATAERNVTAILDAAEALLERHAQASIAAVATQAGVSRVTVYAHFPTREALLEAVVERAVKRATVALEAAQPASGPPLEALDRLIAAGWRKLEHNSAIAQAAAEQLSPAALTRAHLAAHDRVGGLVRRGRAEGSFRTDLPTDWLVTSTLALMHACGDEVRAGRLDTCDALQIVTTTIRDLLTGPPRPTPAPERRGRRSATKS
jgi:TetR/AcrR family transcriptional regulator, mexCD-oprJ operon repressor